MADGVKKVIGEVVSKTAETAKDHSREIAVGTLGVMGLLGAVYGIVQRRQHQEAEPTPPAEPSGSPEIGE
jgi:hypothetical protein